MKIGVFLARFQPIHKSHELIIHKALSENDKVYIFVGSADKSRQERNPFTVKERQKMIEEIFPSAIFKDRLIVVPLNDYSHENDIDNNKAWGEYLYKNIQDTIKQPSFSLYYSDKPEIMLDWFTEEQMKNINFCFLDRTKMFKNLSATKIRRALINDDNDYLTENLPCEIYRTKDKLKQILLTI